MKYSLIPMLILSSFSLTSIAQAGEGAIDASAAFKTNGSGLVEQASFAVGIGKNDAHSDAQITATGTEALAVGTGGNITLGNNDFYVESVSAESPASLQQPQNNQVNQSINIDATTGTTNPDPLPSD